MDGGEPGEGLRRGSWEEKGEWGGWEAGAGDRFGKELVVNGAAGHRQST